MKEMLKKPAMDTEQDVSLYSVEASGNNCTIIVNNVPGCGGTPPPSDPPGSSIANYITVGGGVLTVVGALLII